MTATRSSAPIRDATDLGLYGSLWHFAAGCRPAFVLGIVLLVGSQSLRLALPWFAGRAIDVLQAGGAAAAPQAGLWILALFGTAVATWALHGPGRVLERAVGIHVRRSVTDALFDKLANAPLQWHDRHAASDLQQRMGQTSGALEDFAQNQYVVLQGLVTFVGTLIALVAFSPPAGLVAVAGYVLLVLVGLRFDRSMMKLADEENEASRRFSSALLEFVGGIVTVTALRLQESTRRRLSARLEALFAPIRRGIRLNEAKWCFVDLMTTALTWAVVALYVWQAPRTAGGAILIGGVFVIYKYAEQAGSVVSTAASNFQTFARFRVNYASGDLIWHAPTRPVAATSLPRDWNTIALAHVTYRHAGSTHAGGSTNGAGIVDVGLSMRRGERIALVGPSGSGKSTLMRVMAGLYEADQGHLIVDGVAHLSIAPLASIATFVSQDADVFEADVTENIAPAGVPSGKAWDTALRASGFDAVVDGLSAGAATRIAERGTNLSGGQRQRLALARGILAAHDSSLILLDEPTSALDPLTEAHVYRELDAAFPDACIVASVHRMSALAHFDRVVLMADGIVLGSGTVDEMRASQPLFAAMTQEPDDAREARAAA